MIRFRALCVLVCTKVQCPTGCCCVYRKPCITTNIGCLCYYLYVCISFLVEKWQFTSSVLTKLDEKMFLILQYPSQLVPLRLVLWPNKLVGLFHCLIIPKIYCISVWGKNNISMACHLVSCSGVFCLMLCCCTFTKTLLYQSNTISVLLYAWWQFRTDKMNARARSPMSLHSEDFQWKPQEFVHPLLDMPPCQIHVSWTCNACCSDIYQHRFLSCVSAPSSVQVRCYHSCNLHHTVYLWLESLSRLSECALKKQYSEYLSAIYNQASSFCSYNAEDKGIFP